MPTPTPSARYGSGRDRPCAARDGAAANAEPGTEGKQDRSGQQAEDAVAGREVDANKCAEYDAGQGASKELDGQRAPETAGASVAREGAGCGDDVEQQVGRSDRRAGHLQDVELDRQQEDGPGHSDGSGEDGVEHAGSEGDHGCGGAHALRIARSLRLEAPVGFQKSA